MIVCSFLRRIIWAAIYKRKIYDDAEFLELLATHKASVKLVLNTLRVLGLVWHDTDEDGEPDYYWAGAERLHDLFESLDEEEE